MAEQINPDHNALPSAEDLQGMTDEQVQETRTALEAEAADLRDVAQDDMTDEQIDRALGVADALDRLDADTARRETEAAERAQRITEAQERLNRDEPAETPAEDTPADEAPAEDAPAEDTPAEDAPQGVDALAAALMSAVSTIVASSGAPARPARRRNPRPAGDTGGLPALIAAADIGGGFTAGQVLGDMAEVTQAFIQRSKGFPQGPARSANVRHQHQVVGIERRFADGLHVGNVGKGFQSVQAVLEAAAKESRLSGGSLVAAGGWCAPSENLYGIPVMETLDGIIDLPTIGVDRAGINFTPGPNFADIFAADGYFHQTEAQAIAGTTKACMEVDCPDFDEVRLDAVGFCVKAPLLTRAAYPEVIQRWLEGTIVANQHKVAASLISAMRTALGAAIAPTLTLTPITWSTLTMLELIIEGQRQAHRLSESQALEVKAPRWLRAAIRADLANRNGAGVNSVSNAQIAEHFADRGAVVQWVLNYLELATPLAPTAFPATAEVMVYPAGTFVKGAQDVVNLDTVYDTADLQTNVYTAAFVEDGVLLAKMRNGGARVTLPVHVTGQVGAIDLDQNFGSAQVNADG